VSFVNVYGIEIEVKGHSDSRAKHAKLAKAEVGLAQGRGGERNHLSGSAPLRDFPDSSS
jgi:hypothetical protein